MKTFAFIAVLFLSSTAARADEQLSSSSLSGLACKATNTFGTSELSLQSGVVKVTINSVPSDSYNVTDLGTSTSYGYAYVNLAGTSGGDVLTLVFPNAKLATGQQILRGVLYASLTSDPAKTMVGMGEPWAEVTCLTTVK